MIAHSCHPLAYRSSHLSKARRSFLRCIPIFFLISAIALTGTHPARAQQPSRELHVAAAADLQPVMPKLAAAYEQATGVKLIASFGSSATLTQQILNGAPQDVFLSADREHPEQIAATGQADGAPAQYARGVLVLWARKDSPAQPLSLDSLRKPAVTRVAVANDAHAPYGLAATQAIAALKLTEQLKAKLVVAENVAQTAQFAASGNAQAAFLSLTLASNEPLRSTGTFVRVPPVYPPIEQCGIVLKSSHQPETARQFLQWLTSAATQSKLAGLGLEPATETAKR